MFTKNELLKKHYNCKYFTKLLQPADMLRNHQMFFQTLSKSTCTLIFAVDFWCFSFYHLFLHFSHFPFYKSFCTGCPLFECLMRERTEAMDGFWSGGSISVTMCSPLPCSLFVAATSPFCSRDLLLDREGCSQPRANVLCDLR